MLFKRNNPSKAAKTRKRVDKLANEMAEIWNSNLCDDNFDPNGSYTGNSVDSEKPVQDADDL